VEEGVGEAGGDDGMTRWRTLRKLMAAASAVLALLIGIFLAVSAAYAAMIQEPPPGFQGFWDPPRPPTVLEIVMIAVLLAGGIALFWTGRALPLLTAWVIFACAASADSVALVIPSVRASYGLRPLADLKDVIVPFLFNWLLVVSLVGIALVLPAWLRTGREKAKTQPDPVG
jgi:hypothetical protein